MTETHQEAPAEPNAPSTPKGERYNWKRGIDDLRKTLIDRPAAYIDTLIAKSKNLPLTNYNLAMDFAAKGNHREAVRRFKFTLKLAPSYTACYYPLGMSHAALNHKDDAIESFRSAIASAQMVDEARFMLASLSPGSVPAHEMPSRMPASLAQLYFDQIAGDYDETEREKEYKGHMVAAQYLHRHTDKARNDYRLLDCGCGTGLVGRTLQGGISHITGLDISAAMLEQARNAKDAQGNPTYHMLHHTDLHDYAKTLEGDAGKGQFDFITLVKLPVFLGDLKPLLPKLAHTLKAGGAIVLVYEPHSEVDGYGFSPVTGRYGHGDGYIRTAASEAGLEITDLETALLYPETTGKVAVLKKA